MEKHEEDFQKILNRRAASVQLFVFYLSHGLVQVCKIELSNMGKNKENPPS